MLEPIKEEPVQENQNPQGKETDIANQCIDEVNSVFEKWGCEPLISVTLVSEGKNIFQLFAQTKQKGGSA